MAQEFQINQILQFANISQYLAANEQSSLMQLKSGSIIGNLPGLLYMEGYLLQNINTLNPSSPTLRSNAEYVLSLCGKYLNQAITRIANLALLPPIITGPNSISVNVGQNAAFSVSVTSASPVTYQWFDTNGNPIPGATSSTFTLLNAQLVNSGNTFFVKATNASGTSVSATATLTVTNSIIGSFAWMDTDPDAALQASTDPFTYQSTFPIVHNAPWTIPMPSGSSPNKFLIAKGPSTESAKTTWFNTALNNGTIVPPDAVFRASVTFGGQTYYYTRNSETMDTTQPLVLT